jgi:hypothetical protein
MAVLGGDGSVRVVPERTSHRKLPARARSILLFPGASVFPGASAILAW